MLPLAARGQNVRVRSRTVLWAQITTGGERLEGYLADDRGGRLARRTVIVGADAAPQPVLTNAEGEFSAHLPGGAGPRQITIAFQGDEFYEPSTIVRDFDPSRQPLRLHLLPPSEVLLDRPEAEIQVRAEHADQPAQVPVTITLRPSGEELGRGTTDATGWAHVSIATSALREPGRHTLEASSPGSQRYGPAQATASLLAVDVTRLELSAARGRLLLDDEIELSGRLTGTRGPLVSEVVTLADEDRALGQVATGADGTFELTVPGRSFVAGREAAVIARYDSPLPWRRSSESPAVRILVERPRPMNWGQVVVPVVVTALLLSLVLWVTSRRREGLARPAPAIEERIESGLLTGAVAPRAGRRRERYDLGGQVWDPVRPGPVARAEVSVKGAGAAAVREADGEGRFAFDRLERGAHGVTVGAGGYVPESFRVEMPHHGKLSDIRVHLVQVRHRALELYRTVARRLLPKTALWGRWTPRELAIHAARQRPALADELVDLTSAFEEVYYSPRPNTPGDLERIRELVGRLERVEAASGKSAEDG